MWLGATFIVFMHVERLGPCLQSCWVCVGHLACVKLLLEEGADIEQRNVVRLAHIRLNALSRCRFVYMRQKTP